MLVRWIWFVVSVVLCCDNSPETSFDFLQTSGVISGVPNGGGGGGI